MTEIDDILDTARDCLFGREYAAYAWINIIREHGYSVGGVRGN